MVLLLLGAVAGGGLGAPPDGRAVQLPPEVVLLLFVPVLLHWESITASLGSRADLRAIAFVVGRAVLLNAVARSAMRSDFRGRSLSRWARS